MALLLLLTTLGAYLGLAAAQAGIGDLPPAGQCNLATLSPRVATVQARCCSQGGGCSCAIPCATTLLPLLDDCRPTLDVMLDAADGTRDGVAAQLDELREQCLAIPSAEVLDELKTMHDAGTCSDETLDGVARTDVVAAPCVDVNAHCAALAAAGIQCNEAPMDTGCRATCAACDDDGGGKRRAQITSSCPLKDFDTQAAAVNDACCDDDDCQGVPTVCDAKCAVVFDGFFDRCSSILGLQMADQMPGFTSLHTTCSTQLPVEPLLRAVIDCGVQARVDAINANDYSSWATMQAAGWTWDDGGDEESNGCCFPAGAHLGGRGSHTTAEDCGHNYYNWAGNEKVGTLSLVLPVTGTGSVDFGECGRRNNMAIIALAINGVQVETAGSNTNSVVKGFKFSAGDVLTLQDFSATGSRSTGIIRLNSIHISRCCSEHPCCNACDGLRLAQSNSMWCDSDGHCPDCGWHTDDIGFCANDCGNDQYNMITCNHRIPTTFNEPGNQCPCDFCSACDGTC